MNLKDLISQLYCGVLFLGCFPTPSFAFGDSIKKKSYLFSNVKAQYTELYLKSLSPDNQIEEMQRRCLYLCYYLSALSSFVITEQPEKVKALLKIYSMHMWWMI